MNASPTPGRTRSTLARRLPLLAAGFLLLGMAPAAGAATAQEGGAALAPPAEGGPMRVQVGLWVLDIDSIDSAAQRFVANVFLTVRWKDPRLAHGGATPVVRSSNEVWTPRLQIANESGLVRRTLPDVLEVQGDGEVLYRQRFVGSFSQRLDLTDFPFDEHRFRLHLVLPGVKPAEVEFVPDERLVARGLPGAAGIADDISLPDWRILECTARPLPYVLVPGLDVAGYALEFRAARDTWYWIWKVILPLALIVAMSWSVFWIDPANAGTQIGVATTAMLTLIAYRFAIESRVPPVSYLTRLDWFISGSTVLVFLTLLQAPWTSSLVRHGRKAIASRIDLVSKLLFPSAFAALAAWSFLR
jgi:Neurotransmitter-gated ion-channel ligand binding domain/Neurotransmitter-gated ion-channel transmembrane region